MTQDPLLLDLQLALNLRRMHLGLVKYLHQVSSKKTYRSLRRQENQVHMTYIRQTDDIEKNLH
jgi:hypothetical protein